MRSPLPRVVVPLILLTFGGGASAAAQDRSGVIGRLGLSYTIGATFGATTDRALNDVLAGAGFHGFSASAPWGPLCVWGLFGACNTSATSGYASAIRTRRASSSRVVALSLRIQPKFGFRAQFGFGESGSVSGARFDQRTAVIDHTLRTGSVEGVITMGPFRFGGGPEYTRVSMHTKVLAWDQVVPVAATGQIRNLVGGVLTASAGRGTRVRVEAGLQVHVAPSAELGELRAPGADVSSTTTIKPTGVSFNRGVFFLRGGIRM